MLFRSFKNFITLASAGNTRGADGELNPVDANSDNVADISGEAIFRELQYRAVPARFRGIETEGKFRAFERGASQLDLLLKYDEVLAADLSSGLPLPRITPRRIGMGLDYRVNAFNARLDLTRAAAQGRVAANELPTGGHTMVNLGVSYRVKFSRGGLELFARGLNLLNEDVRNHVSFLKDIAPQGKRSVVAGLRVQF